MSKANFAINGIEGIQIEAGRLGADDPGRYALVISNISTDANAALAPAFGTVVRAGGTLILSGILTVDAPRVQNAVAERGFSVGPIFEDRDWCLLEFTKQS